MTKHMSTQAWILIGGQQQERGSGQATKCRSAFLVVVGGGGHAERIEINKEA